MKIQFVINKQIKEVDYEQGDSLLDTAIRNNINAPYSCMEGVCTACLAQIKQGEVDYPDDTILESSEVEKGRVLTCQAKPKKGCEKVVVDYDAI